MVVHRQSQPIRPSPDHEQAVKVQQGIGQQRLTLERLEARQDWGKGCGARVARKLVVFGLKRVELFLIAAAMRVAVGEFSRQVIDGQAQRAPARCRDARFLAESHRRKLRGDHERTPLSDIGQVAQQIRSEPEQVCAVRVFRIGVVGPTPAEDDESSRAELIFHQRLFDSGGRIAQHHAFGGPAPVEIRNRAAASIAEPDQAVVFAEARKDRMRPHLGDESRRVAIVFELMPLRPHIRFEPEVINDRQRPAGEQHPATIHGKLPDGTERWATMQRRAPDGVALVVPHHLKPGQLADLTGGVGKCPDLVGHEQRGFADGPGEFPRCAIMSPQFRCRLFRRQKRDPRGRSRDGGMTQQLRNEGNQHQPTAARCWRRVQRLVRAKHEQFRAGSGKRLLAGGTLRRGCQSFHFESIRPAGLSPVNRTMSGNSLRIRAYRTLISSSRPRFS